jgi:hypothetical protein
VSDGDDLPNLPADELRAARRAGPLSSEAQLATALLLQARALERSLAGRAQGAAGGALGVPELAALLRRAERSRAEQAEASARRERRLLAVAGAALLAALIGGGSALWIALDARGGQVPPGLASMDDEREAERARISQAVAAAVDDALEQHASGRQALDRALAEADLRASSARAELDDSQAALLALTAEHEALGKALAESTATGEGLRRQLTAARDDRLDQIGEHARLVEQVLERDRQFEAIRASLASLRGAAEAVPARSDAPIVTRAPAGGGSGLATRVSAALRASGAGTVQVVETAGLAEGRLLGLLLIVAEPQGVQRVLEAASAGLASDGGGLQLVCTDARSTDGGEPGPFAIELPAPDLQAWASLGLTLPPGYLERQAVEAALGLALQPHGWSVSVLQDWDGATLLGLELRRRDAPDDERVVRAAVATFSPVGPELVLEQGELTTRGETRPFYGGVYRIALPGADYGRWLSAVSGSSP